MKTVYAGRDQDSKKGLSVSGVGHGLDHAGHWSWSRPPSLGLGLVLVSACLVLSGLVFGLGLPGLDNISG